MTKILLFLLSILVISGCDTNKFDSDKSYTVEKKTIPASSVSLKHDVDSGIVCAWNDAKNENEKYLALVNYVRALSINCGSIQGPATCMAWDSSLYRAAQEHSDDMAKNEKLSHRGSGKSSDITAYDDGKSSSSAEDRAKYHGFRAWKLAENIAKVPLSSAEFSDEDIINGVQAMLNSDNGCQNLMDGYMDSVGIAKSIKEENGKKFIYWTQLVGSNKE